MTTIDYSTPVPYREVTDHNGRMYRIGESDVDIMGRGRKWMVILPWIGMMGISSAEYAFTSAEDTLHEAHLWDSGHIFWLMGVWVFFQAAVAFPAGQAARERQTAGPYGDDARRAVGTLLGYLSLAFAPQRARRPTSASACAAVSAPVSSTRPASTWSASGIRSARAARRASSTAVSPTARCPSCSCSPRTWTSATTGPCSSASVSGCAWSWPRPAGSSRTRRRTGGPRTSTRSGRRTTRGSAGRWRRTRRRSSSTPRGRRRQPVLWMMWFCLLCTAGINIFGIAFQVPFGKDMGFAGGIVATAMSLKAIVNGTGRGVIGWISDRYGRTQHADHRVSGAGHGAVRCAGLRPDGQHAVLPVLLHGLRLRRRGDLPAVRGHDRRLLR